MSDLNPYQVELNTYLQYERNAEQAFAQGKIITSISILEHALKELDSFAGDTTGLRFNLTKKLAIAYLNNGNNVHAYKALKLWQDLYEWVDPRPQIEDITLFLKLARLADNQLDLQALESAISQASKLHNIFTVKNSDFAVQVNQLFIAELAFSPLASISYERQIRFLNQLIPYLRQLPATEEAHKLTCDLAIAIAELHNKHGSQRLADEALSICFDNRFKAPTIVEIPRVIFKKTHYFSDSSNGHYKINGLENCTSLISQEGIHATFKQANLGFIAFYTSQSCNSISVQKECLIDLRSDLRRELGQELTAIILPKTIPSIVLSAILATVKCKADDIANAMSQIKQAGLESEYRVLLEQTFIYHQLCIRHAAQYGFSFRAVTAHFTLALSILCDSMNEHSYIDSRQGLLLFKDYIDYCLRVADRADVARDLIEDLKIKIEGDQIVERLSNVDQVYTDFHLTYMRANFWYISNSDPQLALLAIKKLKDTKPFERLQGILDLNDFLSLQLLHFELLLANGQPYIAQQLVAQTIEQLSARSAISSRSYSDFLTNIDGLAKSFNITMPHQLEKELQRIGKLAQKRL